MKKTREPHLEKDWFTKAGLRSIVLKLPHPFNHRCGYVGVGKDNGFYGVEYNSIEQFFDVYGGLTFSGTLDRIDPDLYWFGYDCAHSRDKSFVNPNGIERTLDFCVEECEQLSAQLVEESSVFLFYLWKRLGILSKERHNKMLACGIQDPSDEFVMRYINENKI